MDSRFYDMPYFIDQIEQRLTGMTLTQVNDAARKYLQIDNFSAVVVTGDAAALRERMLSGAPATIAYAGPVTDDVRMDDRGIAVVPVTPTTVSIVPIREAFEGRGAGGRGQQK
jgi:hypothetical protein